MRRSRALGESKGMGGQNQEKVKLNIDEAFCSEQEEGATGAVVRDEHGAFLGASNSKIPHVDSAAMAEARALKDGLILAGRTWCSKLIVNSDCMEVVNTMQEGWVPLR